MQARPSSIPKIRIWSIIGLAILGDPGAVSGGGTGQKKIRAKELPLGLRGCGLACSAGVFWRGRERVHLIKRAPSWIQTRKRLGERRECVLGSGSSAERRSNGGGGGGGEGNIRLPALIVFFEKRRSPTKGVCDWCGLKLID